MEITLSKVFMSALGSALRYFKLSQIQVKFGELDHRISSLSRSVNAIQSEQREVQETLDRFTRIHGLDVRNKVHRMLADVGRVGAANADIICCFINAMYTSISAITFTGFERRGNTIVPVRSANVDQDDLAEDSDESPDELRHFVCNTMPVEDILDSIAQLADYSSITGGRIATGSISSADEMKKCAHCIAVVFKTFKIFDIDCCRVSAEPNDQSNEFIILRFENQYDLSLYNQVPDRIPARTEIINSLRRNIYILGQNGAGKSSWGNLVANRTPFEVGVSNHTTMIPLSYDVDNEIRFRLWDTPGLFDGTPEEGSMQDHMDYIINMNAYCSAVLFVFPRGRPPDSNTSAMLKYATERIGDFVKTNFIAILNDGEEGAEGRRKLYRKRMRDHGYDANRSNIMLISARNATQEQIQMVKTKLGEFDDNLVEKHRKDYDRIMELNKNNPKMAIQALCKKSKEELGDILRKGRITVRHNGTDAKIPRDLVYFEQNSKSYVCRVLNLGRNKIRERKTVRICGSGSGSKDLTNVILGRIGVDYVFSQAAIFEKDFLSKDSFILLHSPKGFTQCDYELWDVENMEQSQIKSLIQGMLGVGGQQPRYV